MLNALVIFFCSFYDIPKCEKQINECIESKIRGRIELSVSEYNEEWDRQAFKECSKEYHNKWKLKY